MEKRVLGSESKEKKRMARVMTRGSLSEGGPDFLLSQFPGWKMVSPWLKVLQHLIRLKIQTFTAQYIGGRRGAVIENGQPLVWGGRIVQEPKDFAGQIKERKKVQD